MIKSFFKITVLVFFLKGFPLWSQNCDFILSGTVKDLHDGSPIYGAIIRIEGTDSFAQTQENGTYVLKALCAGSVVFLIEHAECNSIRKKVSINSNTTLNFELEHHINALEEIIISDNRLKGLNGNAKESRLNADQISRFSNQSLADALTTLAGVSSLKTGNSIAKPMIHGMYGSRVGIIANGIRLRDQEWGPDHAPNIDLNAFQSVQLVKGATALKYGGDTPGGIIVLSPHRLILSDSLFGQTIMNAATNGWGGSITSKLMKTSSNGNYINGQLTAKRFGDLSSPQYVLSNTGMKEMNISFKLGRSKISKGWELNYSRFQNETGILRSAHIGNIQDLLRALKEDKPLRIEPFTYRINAPKQQGLHQNIHLIYFNQFNDKLKWKWDYNYQVNTRKEFDIRRGVPLDVPAIDLKLQTHSVLGSLQWKKGFNWEMEWGINAMLQDNYSDPNTGVKRLIPDYIKTQLGSYLVGSYKPSNSFHWDWGVRLDHVGWDVQKYYNVSDWKNRNYNTIFPQFEVNNIGNQILVNPALNFLNFAAQTGISIELSEQFNTSFSYVLSQRSPNASELFSDGLHHSLATIEFGSLTLDKESSNKFLFSLTKTQGKLKGAIEPYFSKINNYIFIAPKALQQTIRGAFPVWQYEATDATVWGVDTVLGFDFTDQLNFDINASYTHAQDMKNELPLINIPPFNSSQSIQYSSPKKRFDIKVMHHFTATQNRFPDLNFNVTTLQEDGLIEQEVDVSTPPSAYQKLDVFFSLYLGNIEKSKTSLRFMFYNITQSKYRDYLNRMRFYADEIGRNVQVQFVFSY
jgi:iron complex outermembrane receptor protein